MRGIGDIPLQYQNKPIKLIVMETTKKNQGEEINDVETSSMDYFQSHIIIGGCGFKPVRSGDKDDSKG